MEKQNEQWWKSKFCPLKLSMGPDPEIGNPFCEGEACSAFTWHNTEERVYGKLGENRPEPWTFDEGAYIGTNNDRKPEDRLGHWHQIIPKEERTAGCNMQPPQDLEININQ